MTMRADSDKVTNEDRMVTVVSEDGKGIVRKEWAGEELDTRTRNRYGKGVMGVKRGQFLEMLRNEEFLGIKDREKAKRLEVSFETVQRWMKEAPWEDIITEYRQALAPEKVKIDRALIRKALEGDVAAITLWYERHEGWSRKSGIEVTASSQFDGKTVQDLIRRRVELMGEKERKELMELPKIELLEESGVEGTNEGFQ